MFNDQDKVTRDELSADLQAAIDKIVAGTFEEDLAAHTSNNTIHITALERNYWNNKAATESPVFTGTPQAPTPEQGDSSDRIATTAFVDLIAKNLVPELAVSANKLKTPIELNIIGKVEANPLITDWSQNGSIEITSLIAEGLKGTVPKEVLTGKYDIDISGKADRAGDSEALGGYAAESYALLNSPTFVGQPRATTPPVGDSSRRIATTEFVDRLSKNIESGTIVVGEASKLATPQPVSVSGMATGQSKADFDGSAPLEIQITDIDGASIANVNAATVNGHIVESDVPEGAVFTDTTYEKATHDSDGLMSKEDKTKLDTIEENANYYEHPATHPADMIEGLATVATTGSYTDLENKPKLSEIEDDLGTLTSYVHDVESVHEVDAVKIYYKVADSETANVINIPQANDQFAGLISVEDKAKLDSLESGANAYVHPDTHPASMITGLAEVATTGSYISLEDTPTNLSEFVDDKKFDERLQLFENYSGGAVSNLSLPKYTTDKVQISYAIGRLAVEQGALMSLDFNAATDTTAGVMSAVDKTKLDGLSNYTHPETHPASMITGLADVATSGSYADLTGDATIQNLTVQGNLTVEGQSFVVESTTVTTKDNIIEINSGEAGAGVTNGQAGLVIDRGTEADYMIVFDETDDLIKIGQENDLETIATREWFNHEVGDSYNSSKIFPEAEKSIIRLYQFDGGVDEIVLNCVDETNAGLMSPEDKTLLGEMKTKLDGIAEGANAYVHPDTHPVDMITGLATVATSGSYTDLTDTPTFADLADSDEDYTEIKNGYLHDFATVQSNTYLGISLSRGVDGTTVSWSIPLASENQIGLMSKEDKTKLDSLATVATTGSYTDLIDTPTNLSEFVDDKNFDERLKLFENYSGGAVSNLSLPKYTADKMQISYSVGRLAVEQGYLMSLDFNAATDTTAGIMTAADKVKLDGLSNYTHPDTHPASMIEGLANVATSGSYNDLTDRPTTMAADGGNADTVNNHTVETDVPADAKFTDTTYEVVTHTVDGLMSTDDKIKLDDIEEGANYYEHPANHPASMITGLSTVATSGNYNDLSNRPTIPTVPTKVSELENDANYVTNTGSVPQLKSGDWIIGVTDGKLVISYQGVPKFTFEQDGTLKASTLVEE